MKQSKTDSAIEALTNIMIGAGIALLAQIIWFPIIGKDFTLGENLATTAFFTVVSFCRSYGIRRLFNGKSVYQWIKKRLALPVRGEHEWEVTLPGIWESYYTCKRCGKKAKLRTEQNTELLPRHDCFIYRGDE